MSGMSELHLDWCSHDAARYACENWHYSESTPSGKLVKIGVWEDGDFIGVVIYSRGAAPNIGSPYGLEQTEVCELTRIALDDHDTPVSRIISISLKLLQSRCPGIRVVVSFADPMQDHNGTVYQAANWYYEGQRDDDLYIKIDGETHHPKSLYSKYGTQSVDKLKSILGKERVEGVYHPAKHKYVYPLDDEMKPYVKGRAVPYP
jgi:hypothetical protein